MTATGRAGEDRMTTSAAPTPRPPLGWNSFDCYGCAATMRDLLPNLEAMAARLRSSGYEYFVVDNGWFAEYDVAPGERYPRATHAARVHLDPYGRYLPSARSFPGGLQPLIDRTHALGLKFGLHLMRGIPRQAVELNLPIHGTPYHARDIADTSSVCRWCPYNYGIDMGKPGAQAFYDALVALLAGWGVDLIKADDITGHPAEIAALADAIARCGRPIVLSLSPGGDTDRRHLTTYRRANMLRTTRDIWDSRVGLDRAFAAWRAWQGIGGDGFWPDLDMIPFGHLVVWRPRESAPPGLGDVEGAALSGKGYERECQLTRDQRYTFITMRALAASPLFMGGDLPTTDGFSFALLTDPDMLACNQNGVVGRLIHDAAGLEVWRTPERGTGASGWLGIFNRHRERQTTALTDTDLELPPGCRLLRDIWRDRPLDMPTAAAPLRLDIGPDGVVFCRYEAD